MHLCPMRRPLAVFATHDDLLTGVCRQIGDHGLKRCKVPSAPAAISTRRKRPGRSGGPTIQTCTSVPTRKRGGSGTARSVYRVTKMTYRRLFPPGRGPNKERFIDKVHKGHLRNTTSANRAGSPGLIPWFRGANAQAGIGRQSLCQQGQPGCSGAVTTMTGSWHTAARHRPPVTDPCGPGNNTGAG